MADKPTEDISWAEGASPIVDEPSNQRPNGYPAGFTPPSGFHNWQFRAIGRFLDWLSEGSGNYNSLESFIEDTDPGDTGIVDEYDPTHHFGERIGATAAASTDISATNRTVRSVCCDGETVFTLESGGTVDEEHIIRALDRSDFSVLDDGTGLSYQTGGGTTNEYPKIVCNGEYVAIAQNIDPGGGNATGQVTLYTWDRINKQFGDFEWRWAIGTNDTRVYDIALTHDALYLVGADDGAGTSNVARIPFNAATGGSSINLGDTDWDFNFGGSGEEPVAVAVSNDRVVFLGTSNVTATPGDILVQVYTDGGIQQLRFTIDTTITATPIVRTLIVDERYMWFCTDETASGTIYRWAYPDGLAAADSNALPGFPVGGIAIDSKNVFLMEDSGDTLFVFDKTNLRSVGDPAGASVESWDSAGATQYNGIYCDGSLLFAVGDGGIERRNIEQKPRIWRRVDPSDDSLVIKQLAIPAEPT